MARRRSRRRSRRSARSARKKEKCKEHDLLVKQRAHKRKHTHTQPASQGVCVWHINHTKEFYKMQPKPKVVAGRGFHGAGAGAGAVVVVTV